MNINHLKPINKLNPFTKFCCTIGNLPSSYLDSMTYYEQLLWFCNFLEKTVIPTLNGNAETVQELQNLFVELKNYVDNYFTNLDVQEEINNKLDEMMEDGSLSRLLDYLAENYYDDLQNQLNNLENNLEYQINGFANNLQLQINGLSNGSPLVASSTSQMTDTSKIYVNSTDGNWYYYNGSSWQIGGVYQSTGIAKKSISLDKFIFNRYLYDNYDLSHYRIEGYDTNTFLPIMTHAYDNIASIVMNLNDLDTFTVPFNDSISNQFFVAYTENLKATNSTPSGIISNPSPSHGYYIYNPSSNEVTFNATKLKADGYQNIAIQMLMNNYYVNTLFDGSNTLFYALNLISGFNIKNNTIGKEKLNFDIKNLYSSLNMFNNVGAIGDSYTAGAVFVNEINNYRNFPNQSYIAVMANRAGIPYSNYGKGGATTRSYITDEEGLIKVLNSDPNNFYFICLGINDANQLGINYLGNISDIKEDYNNNEDTFYGNYGKIISKVLEHSPKAKIVLIRIPLEGGTISRFSEAISNIGNKFNLPVINPYDDDFFTSDIYLDKEHGHPTCAGYVGMALAYERLFSDCVAKNHNYFFHANEIL